MKPVSGKAFARILEARGWQVQRICGSHHLYAKPGVADKIALPIHGNKDMKIGLQKHFMKVAGIAESEL